MKNLLLLFILFISTCLFSQKNEIGFTFFKFESNSATIGNKIEPEVVRSVYFNKKFNHLQWYSAVEFNVNEIKDFCEDCSGSKKNYGIMKELFAKTGIGYEWSPQLGSGSFLAYVRLMAKSGWINYDLQKHYGAVYFKSQQYFVVGGEVELGVGYQLKSNITFRIFANTFMASTKYNDNSNAFLPKIPTSFNSIAVAQFAVGYSF